MEHSPSPAPQSLGQAAGAGCLFSMGAGCVSTGTRHLPNSTRSCELALRALEAGQERPVGGPHASVRAVRGRAPSLPQQPVLGADGRGWLLVFHGGCVGMGPATYPIAHPLVSPLWTLWGRHKSARGGGTHASVRGVRGGALFLAGPPILGAAGRGLPPVFRGPGGCGRGDQ